MVLIQIAIYFSNPTYNWDYLLVLAYVFTPVIIYSFLCLLIYKKIYKSFLNEEYDNVIRKSHRFLKIIPKVGLRQYTLLLLGVAYFCSDNKELFKKYINKITDKRIMAVKYYFLTIDLIMEDKWEEAKNQYKYFIDKRYSVHYNFYYNILNTLFNIHDDLTINKVDEIDRLLLAVKNKKVITYLEKLKSEYSNKG